MALDPLYVAVGGVALVVAVLLLVDWDRKWYIQKRIEMEFERLPLTDEEYLRIAGAEPDDAPLWLAVRHAVAETTGLPQEAIHPGDLLPDLLRMQWGVGDFLEIIFRAERELGEHLPPGSVKRHLGVLRHDQPRQLADVSSCLARALRESRARA